MKKLMVRLKGKKRKFQSQKNEVENDYQTTYLQT